MTTDTLPPSRVTVTEDPHLRLIEKYFPDLLVRRRGGTTLLARRQRIWWFVSRETVVVEMSRTSTILSLRLHDQGLASRCHEFGEEYAAVCDVDVRIELA